MIIISVLEPTLSVDEFNMPKVYKDSRAVMVQLTRLILLAPGQIQSHPNMGVGLVQNYRYAQEGSESDLQSTIVQQIDEYLPNYRGAVVQVEYKNRKTFISITIEDTIFMIMYDNNNDDEGSALQTKYMKLSDL